MQPWEDDQVVKVADAPSAPVSMQPWEDSPGQQSQSLPAGPKGTGISADAFERSPNYPNSMMTDPTVSDALTVYGAGSLAKAGIQLGTAGVQGVASLLETPESLKSAGITANALEHMAPGGQNPADYVDAVEKQFSSQGLLGTTARETWDKMSPAAQKAGQGARDAFAAIKQAMGPDAVMVDANAALDPIANEALKRGTGLFSKTENLANPFYDAYDGLQNIAKQQGGKLTIDNIDTALQETGDMMHEGGEAVQKTFAKLYGRLADARDVIVNTVANNVQDQGLKQAFLKNNADYSTIMRVLPTVEKSAYKEAVKEGVSAYQKYIGPLGEKLAVAGGTYAIAKGVIDKVLGNR
jgi:hypothetical protein